jgi:hypothetical protein
MNASVPAGSFRRLAWRVTSESAMQRYIRQRPRHKKFYDAQRQTSILVGRIESSYEDNDSLGIGFDAERAAAAIDNDMDAISACEERNAAREAEAMKHL